MGSSSSPNPQQPASVTHSIRHMLFIHLNRVFHPFYKTGLNVQIYPLAYTSQHLALHLLSCSFLKLPSSLLKMAISLASSAISGGSNLRTCELPFSKCSSFGNMAIIALPTKSRHLQLRRKLSVHAQYSNDDRGGGGGDFVAGFLLGGAVCGTLAYIFAPQIRRSLLNEDEYGFRKARRPIYYDDEGLEKTRETLNTKLSQLNAAIDNVSTRLRGGNNTASVPVESDPEVEATM